MSRTMPGWSFPISSNPTVRLAVVAGSPLRVTTTDKPPASSSRSLAASASAWSVATLDMEHAGKLAREARHSALLPVRAGRDEYAPRAVRRCRACHRR